MVKIRVENRSDNIWAEYDVDLAETVQKLKADIENTEGTAIGRQCLKYGGQELRDEQNLQSYSIQEGSIVEYFPSQNVDKLAEIARIEERAPAEALTARKVGGRDRVRKAGRGGGGGGGGGKEARGKAIYEWDGNMKHPNVKGLPLRIGMTVSQVAIDQDPGPEWPRGYAEDGPDVIGYFPQKYIASLEPNSAQDGAGNLNDNSSGQIPDLPLFRFPKASRLYFKSSAFGERSHSYLQVTLNYDTLARPGDSTPINVTLDCIAAAGRRITSVSLMITSPGQTIKDVGSAQSRGPRQSVHVEATREIENERHGDVTLTVPHVPLEITAGGSHRQEETVVESGTRESQLKIECFKSYGNTTAQWIVKGAEGVGGRRGDVPPTMHLSFILEEKPAIFRYRYFVTTAVKKGTKEKEESHPGESADDGESFIEWRGAMTVARLGQKLVELAKKMFKRS